MGAELLLVSDGNDIGAVTAVGIDGQDAFALLFHDLHFPDIRSGKAGQFFAGAHAVHDGLSDHAEHHPDGGARTAAAGLSDDPEPAFRIFKINITFTGKLTDGYHCNVGILHTQRSLFLKSRPGRVTKILYHIFSEENSGL